MKRLLDNTIILGLMSGTSLDGLDIAACSFSKNILSKSPYSFHIECAETIRYPSVWKEKLSNAYFQNKVQLQYLDKEYGAFLGHEVNQFIRRNNIHVGLIGSHGHTIFHSPQEKYTLQIGSGEQIHRITKIPVVSNFRNQDIIFGGEGAPLVPIGDELLFKEYCFCVNLGGFSNVSWSENNIRKACDVSPCNFLLNTLSQRIGTDFDENGKLSSTGQIVDTLLTKWNALPFYSMMEPKSLGREWFEKNIQMDIQSNDYSINDLLRTSIEHINLQLCNWLSLKKSPISNSKVLVTGGGVYNEFLLDRIKKTLIPELELHVPVATLVEYKEAMIFAFLAYLRMLGKVNVLSSVTGSSQNHSSGDIFI